MKVILEMDGNDVAKFEDILNNDDDNFCLMDSILWELDYGTGESKHSTEYGDITIRQQA